AGGGGGILNYSSHPTLINCEITNNTANFGGGIGNRFRSEEDSIVILNTIIADNNAKNRGGGMSNSIEVNIRIYNSIIWGNTKDGVDADNIYNYSTIGSVRYYHSLIQGSGGSAAWDITFGKDGGNNIDSDPLFHEAANEDYTLADN